MPTLNLNVTLNNGSLDVDQSGNGNQMGRNQTGDFVWKLTGNAASGTFNPIDPSNPRSGFQWKQTPPGTVFGTPTRENQDRHIKLSDNNTDPGGINSQGSWIYQLWATINGVEYSTISTIPTAVVTNPNIKNM